MQINANWCERTIPELARFNSIFVRRRGNGLAHYIVLKGNEKDIEFCFKQEEEFFKTSGITCVFSNEGTEKANDHTIVFRSIVFPDEVYNVYEVANICNSIDLDAFVNMVSLAGFTKELLTSISAEQYKQLEVEIQKLGIERYVNKFLMFHYEHSDEDDFKEADRTYMFGTTKETSVSTSKELPKKEPGRLAAALHNRTVTAVKQEPVESEKETTQQIPETESTEKPNPEVTPEKESEEVPVVTETEETPPEENFEEDEFVPEPVKKPVKKIVFQSKEVLTDEDKEYNKKLLHDLRSKYEETLKFIRDGHSPQYSIFINIFEEALDKNIYTKQLCPVYLEISDDLSTDLYAQLYEIDKATAEFNKKLIHQVYHMGCPFCANEWEEDVTFINPGVHYVRCPKCDMERGYEKE